MTMDAPMVLPPDDKPSAWRWVFAATMVVLIHGGLVYWLTRKADIANPPGVPESAVMIELPPMAVGQPEESVAEIAPGPKMTEAEPEPQAQPEPEKVEPPPPDPEPEKVEPAQEAVVPDLQPAAKADAVLLTSPKPEPTLDPKPEPKPQPKPKPKPKPVKKVEKETPKPQVKREVGPRATHTSAPPRQAAGAPGQASQGASGASASNWRGMVSAALNRNKRYPPGAQGGGTATISFTIDRGGRLVSAHLVGSSGSSALDSEAVSIAHRASPFPPPPPDIGGSHITLTVPVNFH